MQGWRGSSGGWEELCCSAMVAMAMARNWTSKGDESERGRVGEIENGVPSIFGTWKRHRARWRWQQ